MITIKYVSKEKGRTIEEVIEETIDEYENYGCRVVSMIPVRYERQDAKPRNIIGSYESRGYDVGHWGQLTFPDFYMELSRVMIVFESEDIEETEPESLYEDAVELHNSTETKSQQNMKPKTKADKKQDKNALLELEYARLMDHFGCSKEQAAEHHKKGYRITKKGELINIVEKSKQKLRKIYQAQKNS